MTSPPRCCARPLPLAIAFFLVFSFLHFVSLPLLVTWDGGEYIDLADVLGSERFPRDWQVLRTPLFPFSLKMSFSILGKGPLAAELVPFSMGVLGALLVASSVRRIAGDRAASGVLVMLALYPTLAVFDHAILTETGTFFFLACLLRLCLWRADAVRMSWMKALSLGLVLSVGYYWRQTLFLLAPWFVLVHLLSCRDLFRDRRRGWALAGLQALLICALPWGLTQPWLAYFDPALLKTRDAVVLRSFVIRQAVLPPEDARLALVREEYRQAIARTKEKGFLSGLPWPEVTPIANKIPPPKEKLRWFVSVICQYPGRYAAGVGRSLLFFAGFDAAENEPKIYRQMLLSPVIRGSLIGAAPEPGAERLKSEFSLSTGPGLLKLALRGLGFVYDRLLIVCNGMVLCLFAFALARRDPDLLAFSGTPVLWALAHALTLMSLNRFMVPVYPITLAGGVVASILASRRLRRGARLSGRASA